MLGLLVLLPLSLALFLVAAKTHGRQLRLEREQQGYHHVSFGSATNPPWVEALWRADRIRFWTLTPILLILLYAGFVLLAPPTTQMPQRLLPSPESWLVLLWAPSLSFLILGTLSLVRLASRQNQAPASAFDSRAAARGSFAWFAAAEVLLIVVLVALSLL